MRRHFLEDVLLYRSFLVIGDVLWQKTLLNERCFPDSDRRRYCMRRYFLEGDVLLYRRCLVIGDIIAVGDVIAVGRVIV